MRVEVRQTNYDKTRKTMTRQTSTTKSYITWDWTTRAPQKQGKTDDHSRSAPPCDTIPVSPIYTCIIFW